VSMNYGRSSLEKLALWISAVSLFFLGAVTSWRYRQRIWDLGRRRRPDLGNKSHSGGI
jgi:hypothetical protein